MTSMCSLCKEAPESIPHLFSSCRFTSSLWNWFFKIGNFTSKLTNFEEVLQMYSTGFSKRCSQVLRVVAIFVVWNIWRSRNLFIFHNIALNVRYAISSIQALVVLTGNNFTLLLTLLCKNSQF